MKQQKCHYSPKNYQDLHQFIVLLLSHISLYIVLNTNLSPTHVKMGHLNYKFDTTKLSTNCKHKNPQ